MSDHEPAVGIVENDKSLAKHRKKRPNKKIKRYGIAGSSSESQQKDIADHPPTLRHMNPPAIPKGLLGVLSKESEDGGELIRSDATLVKRRERPSRKEGVARLAPKRPHSQTKATDSSSLTAGQTSQSVNGYVQESDTGTAKLDSNNNNDNAPASLVYLRNNGQLVPVVAMPQTPPNYIDDIVAVENDGVLSLLIQNIMSVGQDVKTILRNQENFHMRLSALEGERNALAPEGGASISLPLDTVEDFKEKEEQLSNDAVARKQLVLSLSLMGGSKVYDTSALMLRSLMSKELRLQFTAQIPKEGKMVFKNTNLFQVVQDAIRQRPRFEKGGREKRQEDAAFKKIAFEEYKKSHPEKFQSRGKKESQDDGSSSYSSHSSDENVPDT
ncbi:hypothetical protein OUZ56_029518 [Daphnia magna]|uniref:DUF4806 domain-containing protein n=1 Tax=Daphnia magna TaxID=35525 RepID=A0ABR0B737_9CRUS|nr:hypothetical protein OUZ56_029518 [Daphnia magna]